jgi:hypothetical protein
MMQDQMHGFASSRLSFFTHGNQGALIQVVLNPEPGLLSELVQFYPE